ncbi:unnamed protein product [Rhizophagus irregularis]|nr:unnamed protein product [Rhizophagus irregularis]
MLLKYTAAYWGSSFVNELRRVSDAYAHHMRLSTLQSKPNTCVYILSGRGREHLDQWDRVDPVANCLSEGRTIKDEATELQVNLEKLLSHMAFINCTLVIRPWKIRPSAVDKSTAVRAILKDYINHRMK